MQINRLFTKEGTDVFSMFNYVQHECVIKDWNTGKEIFRGTGEVPEHWSKTARNTLISKYFRKGGVPTDTIEIEEDGVPDWLLRRVPMTMPELDCKFGGEFSVKQVVRRIAGHWTYVGFKNGYFDPTKEQIASNPPQGAWAMESDDVYENFLREKNASAYYDEMAYMILNQMAAPNSPQWFNTGLWWAYGIEGPKQGHHYVDLPANTHSAKKIAGFNIDEFNKQISPYLTVSPNAYERVQAHACFILTLNDTMLGDSGITQWWETEARIFKYGSGSGTNISNLRASKEKLSGGGRSSGPMPFMKVADTVGGAIKSGGTTRRAAKMVCMDLDHPDILDFINCKMESELMVGSMVSGSKLAEQNLNQLIHLARSISPKTDGKLTYDDVIKDASVSDLISKIVDNNLVTENHVDAAIRLALETNLPWPGKAYDIGYEGPAYSNVPYQNANNSVRVPSKFFDLVDSDGNWQVVNRKGGDIPWEMSARELERMIALAGWFCADPGVQYDTIINDWNVTPKDGRINASNPCSEHMRLDDSACNLASLNLAMFLSPDGSFDVEAFLHAVWLWQFTLDVTVTMSHLPSAHVAMSVYNYRDTGLGYASLGSLLMRLGIAYDSDAGRQFAGELTALMHAQCHFASAQMAEALGAYPRFWSNSKDHMRCVRNHRVALGGPTLTQYEGLTVEPDRLFWTPLAERADSIFDEAYMIAETHGFRNAEMTVIAPTGTISLIMDCDTTGVEPMFGLSVMKTLAGGGNMVLEPTTSVKAALKRLGYEDKTFEEFTEALNNHTDPLAVLQPEDRKVFATAVGVGDGAIPWDAHLTMMAAVQPFISGAISKTINMPHDATIEDVRKAYRLGHNLGLKSVALYRDACKLSQPLVLNTPKKEKSVLTVDAVNSAMKIIEDLDAKREAASKPLVSPVELDPDIRVKLPWCRRCGLDLCVGIGYGHLYVKTSHYEDGRIGEIWVTYTADQGIIQAMITQACKMANVSLQHGMPLQTIIDTWKDSVFEPRGMVNGHPFIKMCTSPMNLVAKLLEWHILGNEGVLDVKPGVGNPVVNPPKPVEILNQKLKITGETCPACGSQNYVQAGTCKKCTDCMYSGGCG